MGCTSHSLGAKGRFTPPYATYKNLTNAVCMDCTICIDYTLHKRYTLYKLYTLNNIQTKNNWMNVETLAKLKGVTKKAVRISINKYE